MKLLRRGDIVLTDFAPARDREANYTRPAIVISNNDINLAGHMFVVIPLTSNTASLYSHDLLLPLERTNLDRDSKAQVDLIRHVHPNRFIKTLGFVPDDLMLELDQRIREHLAL